MKSSPFSQSSNQHQPDDSRAAVVCPQCHHDSLIQSRSKVQCSNCLKNYPDIAGFTDFRTHSDRYLSLNQERQKAIRLAENEMQSDLEELTRIYYRMTADVDTARRERFVQHVLDADLRGQALLACLPEQGEILDVGCGTGGFLKAAANSGRTVTGVDIAIRWLVVARKRIARLMYQRKVRIIPACVEALPFAESSFDLVVADSLLEHLEKPENAIAEMVRVLRPGGCIWIWSPNRYWIGADPHVGLFGIGFLPRSWGEKYKNIRRGSIFWPKCHSSREWASFIKKSFPELQITYQSANTTAWPGSDRSLRGIAARMIGRMSQFFILRVMLTLFGPIGQVVIQKPLLNHQFDCESS